MTALPAAELLAAQPPLLERPDALAEIRDRIGSHGRLLVIDDDRTGTQSVHGVPVLTAWSREDLAGALRDAGTVFVLTNSSSLPEREAIAISTEITERAVAIAPTRGSSSPSPAVATRPCAATSRTSPRPSPTRWAARSTACCSARAFSRPDVSRSTTSNGWRRMTSSSRARAPPTPRTDVCPSGLRRARLHPKRSPPRRHGEN